MRTKSKLLALALAAALQPAFAGVAPITVNFEDIASSVDAFDGVLSLLEPGYVSPATGVQFAGASLGISSRVCNGVNRGYSWNFPVPAVSGCNAFMLADADLNPNKDRLTAIIKITGGFITGNTSSDAGRSLLHYSAKSNSGLTITAYENLDLSGKFVEFSALSRVGCSTSADFCDWQTLYLDVGFTAHALKITGLDQQVALDDLQFVAAASSTQPPARLPEPASLALALGALGALGWSRKRSAS